MESFTAATEAADKNQYWYSAPTIAALVAGALELAGPGGRVAFLSTPSLFFSLPPAARAPHAVLDIDEQWAAVPGFHRFDFNDGAAGIPDALRGAFAAVVIDPPFITEPVWRQYAAAAHALLAPGGAVLCTTVAENGALLAALFPGCAAVPFQPSIPRLVCVFAPPATREPAAKGRPPARRPPTPPPNAHTAAGTSTTRLCPAAGACPRRSRRKTPRSPSRFCFIGTGCSFCFPCFVSLTRRSAGARGSGTCRR